MISLFRKQPELLFNLSHISTDELINTHKHTVSSLAALFGKENDLSTAIDGFQQAIKQYNGSIMGDFVSFSELCIAKALKLGNGNKNIQQERQIEVEHYIKQLKKFKVSLVVVSSCEITEAEKQLLFTFIKNLQNNTELKVQIFNTKKIPYKTLGVKDSLLKLIKKNQPYVLAMMLLHMYDYKHLYNFMGERT